ncbi:MAG: hypothetical protein KAW83_01975 [Dehalococcoidia bacterium]|nr:hypothetical protein [Dehalococcoidia bacterium]
MNKKIADCMVISEKTRSKIDLVENSRKSLMSAAFAVGCEGGAPTGI